jgi:hypothetical protein
MAANLLSPLIDGEISRTRRVFHSATNYVMSIDRSSFGFDNVTNAANNFAGTAGGVGAGIAMAVGTGAASVVAGAGFLAAIAGPQVAITAAVVGVALLVKGAYSNREAAHKTLSKYVWNMVDNVPPTHSVTASPEHLHEAVAAAATLMEDGKNQLKLLKSKLDGAHNKFVATNIALGTLIYERQNLVATYHREKGRNQKLDISRLEREIKYTTDMLTLWTKETSAGGSIFEYVRRCSHTGNYLQAPHIIALGMKEKQFPGYALGKAQPDYFEGCTQAKNSRVMFAELSDQYKLHLHV